MTKFMLLAMITLMSTNLFAEETAKNDCRSLIVAAYKSIGQEIEANSFSNTTYEELNISPEEFNAMSSAEQEEIYNQIKPIQMVANDTANLINRYIEKYSSPFYSRYMADELMNWRSLKDQLRVCK